MGNSGRSASSGSGDMAYRRRVAFVSHHDVRGGAEAVPRRRLSASPMYSRHPLCVIARCGASSCAPRAQLTEPAPAMMGPTMRAAAVSPVLQFSSTGADANTARMYTMTNGEKLMVLGGVALLTGAIIGGDAGTIIMVGGAAVGLYGLYVQLNRPHGVAELG